MTLDNITGITKGSYTGNDMFCKSQLITCNFVKACNGICPFEDALKHADKEMNEQTVIDHDRDWIIGCIEHDGFIHTHRFDKANQIILDALLAEAEWIPCDTSSMPPEGEAVLMSDGKHIWIDETVAWWGDRSDWIGIAWMPLPKPYKGGDSE